MSESRSQTPISDAEAMDWKSRTHHIVETMRQMSVVSDPQEQVRAYSARMQAVNPSIDAIVALSRRELSRPYYRITRSHLWGMGRDPWREKDRLPVHDKGLLGEFIYSDRSHYIEDLRVSENDPAYEHLAGFRSLVAIPVFDGGQALNMTVILSREPRGWDPERIPDMVLTSALFGRATQSLVLMNELRRVNHALDREMQQIADIQKSLLPAQMPQVPGLDMAVHYQTSAVSGGDYYDFFPLPDGRWGILIADVSGHGSPAAVMMAITHSIVHTSSAILCSPSKALSFVNHHLGVRYTGGSGRFVTAFYAAYDPRDRTLLHANAGHPPPRLRRAGSGAHTPITPLGGVAGLPLGIEIDEKYPETKSSLAPGDTLVFFTDGITEGFDPRGRMFGLGGLDRATHAADGAGAGATLHAIQQSLADFSGGRVADDDRTLLVMAVK